MKIDIGPYPDDDSPRQVEITIHNYDTWSLDKTLALIIPPLLRQLKSTKHGVPVECFADDYDGEYTDEAFAAAEARWAEVMDKMILAFELVRDWDDWEDIQMIKPIDEHRAAAKERKHQIDEGLALFAKYYRSLWD